MCKPSDFDPAKQYPIVVNIYPGPQQGSIDSRSFRPTYDDNQALAELGFIVIPVDGMGTPLRSKSFQDVSSANMAANTLPDQAAALKQLGAQYPCINLYRIGMRGKSRGGTATADALLNHPDAFKFGTAEHSNPDTTHHRDNYP